MKEKINFIAGWPLIIVLLLGTQLFTYARESQPFQGQYEKFCSHSSQPIEKKGPFSEANLYFKKKSSALKLTSGVNIIPGDKCSDATDISSYIGVDSNGHVNCIVGNNANSGAIVTPVNCWASDADDDVWYKFTVPGSGSSWWTISTDNGINDFDTDAQLALYSSCNDTAIACNEDLESETESDNSLAAGFTVKLTGGNEYFLQVDVFGAGAIESFALTIFKNEKPVNSCISNAFDVNSAYDALNSAWFTSSEWFIYNPYTYIDSSSWAPSRTLITGTNGDKDNSGCNSQLTSDNFGRTYYDVWLKFAYDSSQPPTWISVYPKNGHPLFGLELWRKNTSFTGCNPNTSELTRIGCSLPDGLPECGDEQNRALGCFLDHPRLNLNETQLINGDTIFIRIYQYTRITITTDTANIVSNIASPPSEGLFKLVFEQAPGNCLEPDGMAGDYSCCDELLHLNADDSCYISLGPSCKTQRKFTNLCNAGKNGGLTPIEGSTCTGIHNEPGSFEYNGNTTATSNDCDNQTSEGVTTVLSSSYNNNSAYYRFSICPAYQDNVDISNAYMILTSDPAYQDTVMYVNSLICKNFRELAGESFSEPADTVISEMVSELVYEQAMFADSIMECGVCCIPATCAPRVKFCFSNLKNCGINGSLAEFFVLPADDSCSDSIASGIALAAASPESTFDTCLCFYPTQPLSPGEYDLVVDGENGSLVNFDLEIITEWVIAGTDICCMNCEDTEATVLIQNQNTTPDQPYPRVFAGTGIQPDFLIPTPAKDHVILGYTSTLDGNVQYAIVDLNGKTVEEGSFSARYGENTQQFNLKSFANGIYVLKLNINAIETRIKLIKE